MNDGLEIDEILELVEILRGEVKKLRARVTKLERAADWDEDEDDDEEDNPFERTAGQGGYLPD